MLGLTWTREEVEHLFIQSKAPTGLVDAAGNKLVVTTPRDKITYPLSMIIKPDLKDSLIEQFNLQPTPEITDSNEVTTLKNNAVNLASLSKEEFLSKFGGVSSSSPHIRTQGKEQTGFKSMPVRPMGRR